MNYEEIRARSPIDRCCTMGGPRQIDRRFGNSPHVTESPAPVELLPAQYLAADELLAVSDGVATTVRIESGEVSITEEGSFIDHILCAGQQYTIDRSGRAIVAARTKSRVAIYSPRIGAPPRSVERGDSSCATSDLLYARSPFLNAIASLIPLWAYRPAVALQATE
jgi:hypothetical protein